jgi:hypothetical protein
MSRAELTPTGVIIHFQDIALASERNCFPGSTLVKADGSPWVDERPPCGQAYYLDDVYEENPSIFGCGGGGCDVQMCYPFRESQSFPTLDYVRTGSRPAPAGGAGGQAGGGGAPIPDIERRVYRGALTLTIRYFTNDCPPSQQSSPPVTFTVASDLDAGAGN